MINTAVHSVTINLESSAYSQLALGRDDEASDIVDPRPFFYCPHPEMRSSNECYSPLLPDYQESRVDLDIGGPPCVLSSPTPPSVPPLIRPYPTRRPKRHRPQQPNYAMQTAASALDGELLGRKPVIYLYLPSSLSDVTVGLRLTPSWRFSAVYPPPQATLPSGEQHTAQSLTWVVAAEPSGILVDKTTGTEVSYLYWEAM